MPIHLPATRFSPSEHQYRVPARDAHDTTTSAQPSLPRLTLLGKPKTPPMAHGMPPPLPYMPLDLYPPPPLLSSRGRSNTGASSIYADSSPSSTTSRKSSFGANDDSPSSSRTSVSEFSNPPSAIPRSRSPAPPPGWKPPQQSIPAAQALPAKAPPLFQGPIDWSLEYSPAPNPFGTPAPVKKPQTLWGKRPELRQERPESARPPPLRVRKEVSSLSVDMRLAAAPTSSSRTYRERTPRAVEQPFTSPRDSNAPRRLESRYFKDGRTTPRTAASHAKSRSYLPMSPTEPELKRNPTVRAVSAPSPGFNRQDLFYVGDEDQPPATPGEISLVWQHASLLFHNNRAQEALSTFQSLQSRRGIPSQVMARVSLNIGIINTSIAHASSDPRSNKPPHVKKDEAEQAYYQASEAFHTAINKEPGGLVGAAGTFLLGCALFDAGQHNKAADCFEMCESVFVTEGWAPDDAQRYATADEEVRLAPIGIAFTLRLRDVRANFRVCQERSRGPQAVGTNLSLVRIGDSMLAETFDGEDLRSPSDAPIPITELEESGAVGDIEIALGPKVSPLTGGMPPLKPFSMRELAEAPISPPTPRGVGPGLPEPSQQAQAPRGPPARPSRPGDGASRGQRNVPGPQPRAQPYDAERERKKRDRQTVLLIKLGDLRLNKPLPPLPAGARESDWRHVPRRTAVTDFAAGAPPMPKMPAAYAQVPRSNAMGFM